MGIEYLKTDKDKIEYLSNLLKNRARGNTVDDAEYKYLREELLANLEMEDYLPSFIRTNGDISSFWAFIKEKFGKYNERVTFISEEFKLVNMFLDSKVKGVTMTPAGSLITKELIVKTLKEYFDTKNEIHNIYGTFKLTKKSLGAGGTSHVKEFEFDGKKYAIKFLLDNIMEKKSKVFKRFKQAHLNLLDAQSSGCILPQYHFDKIQISDKIAVPYIIMPIAKGTLRDYVNEQKKSGKFNFKLFKKIFYRLLIIIDTIHAKNIIHRDIKPENLFILNNDLVLGDFDIAKFDSPEYIKLVETKNSDRMANYFYSAPEQSKKDFEKITAAADWYAVGQIFYWLITDSVLRGQQKISFSKYGEEYVKYESLINNLLSEESTSRLSSKNKIEEFLIEQEKVTWEETLHNFDDIILKYMSEFGMSRSGLKEYKDTKTINEIMSDVSKKANRLNLWWSQGYSDLQIGKILKENNLCEKCWCIGFEEIKIKSIWIHKHHSNFGGSFLIIETDELEPTGIYPTEKKFEEFGVYEGKYIKREEYDTGWAMIEGERVEVVKSSYLRARRLNKTIYFLAPHAGPLIENDNLIDSICKQYLVSQNLIKEELEDVFKKFKRSKQVRWAD